MAEITNRKENTRLRKKKDIKMIKARKYVVNKHFQGFPQRQDYDIVEEELPPLKNGEILINAEWVSVDPYLRATNAQVPVPYDQFGFQVGIVTASKNPKYPVGTRVVSHKGWCDYSIINPNIPAKNVFDTFYKLPNFHGLSASHGVGAVGMTGVTAYFGLLEICKPKSGETVVVTGAAGAVGSLVGQIAKIKGCKVIGFAGSDEKVKWLESTGFDKAFNYKTVDVFKALDEAAPEGVVCYFDNVGGEISNVIMSKMNMFGRVAICGSISVYNEDSTSSPKASLVQPLILSNQLKVEGFQVYRWSTQWPKAFEELAHWISSGQLKAPEHITTGFENIFNAFLSMLNGENSGKAVVKI